jgi:hypothetical protein
MVTRKQRTKSSQITVKKCEIISIYCSVAVEIRASWANLLREEKGKVEPLDKSILIDSVNRCFRQRSCTKILRDESNPNR